MKEQRRKSDRTSCKDTIPNPPPGFAGDQVARALPDDLVKAINTLMEGELENRLAKSRAASGFFSSTIVADVAMQTVSLGSRPQKLRSRRIRHAVSPPCTPVNV